MRTRRHPIEDLRSAIDCLPADTRMAMLQGVRSNEIIVGAYTDRRGGVCPMLAAHRCGGRTSFISFAKSWDRFTRARGRARRASEREVRILTGHLEASLMAEHRPDLDRAINEHKALVKRHGAAARRGEPAPAAPRVRPGDPDRSKELGGRPGWAWLRPFRRYDDYARALERVQAEREALAGSTAETAESREPTRV